MLQTGPDVKPYPGRAREEGDSVIHDQRMPKAACANCTGCFEHSLFAHTEFHFIFFLLHLGKIQQTRQYCFSNTLIKIYTAEALEGFLGIQGYWPKT